MLKKLLKYDMRSNLRIFAFIWPAILLFALLERGLYMLNAEHTVFVSLLVVSAILFVFAMVGAYAFAVIYSVQRFYNGLLRNEGYLMFTLPVKPWQLILSKLITAFVTTVVTLAMITLACFVLLAGFDGVGTVLHELYVTYNMWEIVLQLLLEVTVGLLTMLLQFYLACSIGQLVNRHRILCSVLIFFGLEIVVSVIGSVLNLLYLTIDAAIWISMGASALLGVAYFFLSERLLRRHLNLE